MSNLKRICCSLLVAALALTALSGCAAKADPNKLRVGMECAYAPFNWTQDTDANGAVPIEGGGYAAGYDVEIAKMIAEGLGKELVIVKTDWGGLAPSITSGKIDLIVAGMSNTADRRETIDFTDPYYASALVVVVRGDGPYAGAKTLSDFAGAKITGQLGTLHYDVIDQLVGVNKQIAMDTFPLMVTALTSGKIDGYISEKPGALGAVFTNPELSFVEFASGKGFDFSEEEVTIAVGLKKGSPLKEEINKILAGLPLADRKALMDQAVSNQPKAE